MIELRNVSKTVISGTEPLTIVQPLDLRVASGQYLSIVGPSGSGKSTLLGLIAGLDVPTTGEVVIDGVEITALGEDALARLRGEKIGVIFQFFHLMPSLTAFENVLVPLEIAGVAAAGTRAAALLSDVGLDGRAHHYPAQLSGGEQQRVAIARALANDPPILLADEPTGNLDEATSDKVLAQFLELVRGEGSAALVATHNERLAARMDRVVRLHEGVLVDGPGSHSAR